MRILHVLESLAPGGIETTFLHMLRVFRAVDPDIRHEVLAFAGGPLEDDYRHAAHRLVVGCDGTTISSHVEEQYAVVHLLFERCAYRLIPELLARSSARVVYGKGYDMAGMYRLNEGLRWQPDESMLASCDRVTFTTHQLASGYRLPPGRTTTLGKAADVARFLDIGDPDPNVPPRVVCIANVHPRKRIGDLVLAMDSVCAAVPDAALRIIGTADGQEAARIRALSMERGLGARVTFAGYCADVAPELASAHVVALPSSCEGVPTALLEAMSAGRPVVATRVGHVSSVIDDGVEGFLYEAGDVRALASSLIELLLDRDRASAMGRAARARAAAHDVRDVARRLLDALRRAA